MWRASLPLISSIWSPWQSSFRPGFTSDTNSPTAFPPITLNPKPSAELGMTTERDFLWEGGREGEREREFHNVIGSSFATEHTRVFWYSKYIHQSTHPQAFMLNRLETFRVMESNICFSDWRRISFFSASSRLEPRLSRDREGGGDRSMRGRILKVVALLELVSFCRGWSENVPLNSQLVYSEGLNVSLMWLRLYYNYALILMSVLLYRVLFVDNSLYMYIVIYNLCMVLWESASSCPPPIVPGSHRDSSLAQMCLPQTISCLLTEKWSSLHLEDNPQSP